MSVFLFIIYFIGGCFLMSRSGFIKASGLGTKNILWLFTLKIAAGCFVGLINHFLFQNQTDYDAYNAAGIEEYNMLFADPHRFFTDIFKSNYAEYGEFFGSSGSYWNDLRTNIIFKILGFLNILSRGNYYINCLFFNSFCFIGHIALYRVFINEYPLKKIQCIIGCAFLPSLLYFTSGIHKDLIVFTALAVFCYALYFSLKTSFSTKKIFFLIISFLIILFIRNFIAVLLLPCALGWAISYKFKIKPSLVFLTMFFSGIASTAFLHFYILKFDPLKVVADKQQAFLSLGTTTTMYHNDTLQPTIQKFVTAAPGALRHSFLSPYPGEFNNIYINLFAVEIIIYAILFLTMLIIPEKKNASPREFLFFSLTFTFFVFLFAGYITPAAGALIRYRSIYLPFLITPLLCNIGWSKIKITITNKVNLKLIINIYIFIFYSYFD